MVTIYEVRIKSDEQEPTIIEYEQSLPLGALQESIDGPGNDVCWVAKSDSKDVAIDSVLDRKWEHETGLNRSKR